MAEPDRHPLGAPLAPGTAAFGTDGIRGRVGQLITPALALQLGYWCGRELPQDGPIVLGMDSRSSGPMLVAALAAGLTAAGRDVLDIGLCPTPAVPGTIRRKGAAPQRITYEPLDSLKEEFDVFADAVAGNSEYPIKMPHMVNVVAAFEAIVQSIETGSPVSLNRNISS